MTVSRILLSLYSSVIFRIKSTSLSSSLHCPIVVVAEPITGHMPSPLSFTLLIGGSEVILPPFGLACLHMRPDVDEIILKYY